MLLKHLLTIGLVAAPMANAQVSPVVPEAGVSAHAFDMSQVTLSNSRWSDNQKRTLS
jgi:hypothetical protein